jgi:hypothetical protein
VGAGESIIDRIESALEKARWRKLKLRGLYLDHQDYADFAHAETLRYQRETGSGAILWPLSFDHVLILNEKSIPVKGATVSAVYGEHGEKIVVPKQLSPRTRAA